MSEPLPAKSKDGYPALLPQMANRHGSITCHRHRQTVTLQSMAERPSFLPGAGVHGRCQGRPLGHWRRGGLRPSSKRGLKIRPVKALRRPTWSPPGMFSARTAPVRATISDMGPVFARLLNLNET